MKPESGRSGAATTPNGSVARVPRRKPSAKLDEGKAISRHGDNKGNRDDVASLHPVVVDHLRKLKDFSEVVFCWPHHKRRLWVDFARIQKAAGINLTGHAPRVT